MSAAVSVGGTVVVMADWAACGLGFVFLGVPLLIFIIGATSK